MSRPEPGFTMDELLEELSQYFQEAEEDCYTTKEIARRVGRGRAGVFNRLRQLAEEGNVDVTTKKVVRFGDGAWVPVTAWRLRREE